MSDSIITVCGEDFTRDDLIALVAIAATRMSYNVEDQPVIKRAWFKAQRAWLNAQEKALANGR